MTSAAERRFGAGAWPWLLLAVAAFVVSTNHVLGRHVSGEIPPFALAFWRVAVGAAVLAPFAWRELALHRALIVRHWKLFALMAIALMPSGNAVVYLAYNFTTAVNGGVISTAQPAVTVLLAWLVLGHTINAKQAIGIAIAAAGVQVIIARGDPAVLGALRFNSGDLLLLVAIVGFSLYTVLLPRVPAAIGPMLILILVQLFGAVALAPFYIAESIAWRPVPLTWEAAAVIAWLGTAIAVVAVGLNNIAVLALGPAKASVGHYLRALFIAAMALVVLGERLEAFHYAAFALVVAGIWLMSRGRTRARRTA